VDIGVIGIGNIGLGLAQRLRIETPLMWIDKAATWRLAEQLGGQALVELIVEHTHTCYQGERGARHAWGYGCGECPACSLRARGWAGWRSSSAATRSKACVAGARRQGG